MLLHRTAPFEFWQSITGSLDAGESAAEAAARELFEETGLSSQGELLNTGRSRVFTIDPRWRDRFAPGVTENLEHEFRYRVKASLDIQIDPKEHSEWEWVSIGAALDRVWSWTNREALEALRKE